MQVTVLSATEKPVELISMAAGTCYGKGDLESVSKKRLETCFQRGHMSVFEHAVVSFRIEGISRSCMAQLTRHRHVSFCVESQRYCKYDLSGDDWYVVPPSIDCMNRVWFDAKMQEDAQDYLDAIQEGIKPEDARYLLPEATKTNLVATINVRELFHIFDMRMDKAAQWEIRDLVAAMRDACYGINREWRELMDVRA